ncbi:uncharacterized protein N7484_010657 [Penicillium longicatenatum]|uniref:uncharacterized protein n=1 Tax=Penicillium longicatenatum TaxID=1561947 RepID=UPI0025493497|nr:uncharacterized protein N7484_010657 [Penicillium longicatenatum]KAJ5630557.1 hypothetical protein N7484_010657 [Penicillium longicatenatum]
MGPSQVQVPCLEQPSTLSPSQTNSDANPSLNASNLTEVDMGGTQETVIEVIEVAEDITPPDAQAQPELHKRKNTDPGFLDILTSPMVDIIVGQGENKTTLKAHQTLLLESPFMNEFISKFETAGPRRILLPTENVETFGCFLQFQYTRDYTVTQSECPSTKTDDSGEQLLRHARIYTLAEKLGLPHLKSLAHKNIHKVRSTPGGELAYARYVYTHTQPDDTPIRKPVASYWATRGHILRHDLEDQFKKLCVEVPDFAFDVLTVVMDRNEKSSETGSSVRDSARKRRRSEK